MDKQVVVVTGAAGDIGTPLTKKLIESGYHVVACVRDIATSGLEVNDDLTLYECDFSDSLLIKECVSYIKKSYKEVYAIVNCVGVAHGGSFMLTKPEEIKQIFDINYFAIIDFTQQLVRKMLRRKTGCIINITSTAGILSDKGTIAYGASKAALIHTSKVMATELGGFGIRVNAIAPAVVESKMAALMDEASLTELDYRACLNSKIYPQEIVDTIEFLLSDSARNITGQVITIDRGITR
jgi:3-oxoacyl-[acyl-carrier protein] reductase